MYNNIIEILEHDQDIYPGKKNAKKCKILLGDNSTTETLIHNEEVELCLYLKTLKRQNRKLNSTEFEKLNELIENFGDCRYNEGGDNEHID